MAKFDRASLLLGLTVTVIMSSWIPMSQCAKKPVGVARKEDIPFIKCQVCEKLASQLYHQVQAKQAEISPKIISEYQIIEIAENVCNLKKQEADWILKIDIVEQGDRLELVEQVSEGQCGSECKTIERACQEVLGYSDTDVAEYLYKNKPDLHSLVKFICKDLTKACSKKPPPIPKDRTPGEPFIAKSSKEAEMDKLLKSMEGMPGAPSMKMYSREDLMKNMGDVDAEDEDEDEDEEPDFPSKLGKVLREKDSKKNDWKQRITKGVVDTGKKLKSHANRVSNRIRQWWSGKKTILKNKSSKSNKAEL
ncbi:nucleophosmin isoform X1 [Olea europaea subsp. europaea]|uniref:Nucleophosmin isoform X1 n=1 Tax=Olea europaea subsp. europaea TaxID=158383 RepID=A0A8S0UZQ4_OLEEU|nr:nucleophosmin isoform X1 [Olea europaea subsp. europaea]